VRNIIGLLVVFCLATACSAKHEDHRSTAGTSRHPAKTPQAPTPESEELPPAVFSPAEHLGSWYRAGNYRVRTLVRTASIVPAADLPRITYRKNQYDFCGGNNPTPQTRGGTWARSRGWHVGAEAPLGPLTLVNVLRSYYYEGQVCGQIDGKILVFEGDRPIAVLNTSGAEGYQADSFGGQDGVLRLVNIRSVPFGDVTLHGQDIEIRPLPSADRICGRKTMPNLFGQRIGPARRILHNAGWRPIPADPPEIDKFSDGSRFISDLEGYGFYRKGLTEVITCTPTSFCYFAYRSGKAMVTVTTSAGFITDYMEEC
jgi:hypothetical protein